MAFDPHQRPMSLEESERLIRKADERDLLISNVKGSLFSLGSLLSVVGIVALTGLSFWLLGQVVGTIAALVLGIAFFSLRGRF